jgi:hypothetical protein
MKRVMFTVLWAVIFLVLAMIVCTTCFSKFSKVDNSNHPIHPIISTGAGLVSVVIIIGSPLLAMRLGSRGILPGTTKTYKSETYCPECKNQNTVKASGKFRTVGFQAFSNRSCEACGTAWRPTCPKGLAMVCIFAGIVGVLISLLFFSSIAGAFFLCIFGLAPIIYGVRVLTGKTGQIEILGRVEEPTPDPPANRPGYKPCVACEKGIEESVRLCPHCGWMQPS